MTSASVLHTGSCYCGSIRFRVTADFKGVCICHCHSCQRASGAPVVAWATIDRAAFHVDTGDPARISLRPGVERGFCRDCGTSLTYLHADHPGEIDVCVAALDDAASIKPKFHIWTADQMPWMQMTDGLPRYPGWRSDSA